ncbi:ATP-dependent DNA family protein [Babesia ovata]|uniref:DNA 3'-5' helicase n=1 Tax=Babesia ovata TaxID=189622 RepID=A0A2H6KFX6_9APIC|nr:ATP-dependent DNA family protein [Babesia ovata]GBE61884.1 ATP-dependent DNA family protein [Babesia ovata]
MLLASTRSHSDGVTYTRLRKASGGNDRELPLVNMEQREGSLQSGEMAPKHTRIRGSSRTRENNEEQMLGKVITRRAGLRNASSAANTRKRRSPRTASVPPDSPTRTPSEIKNHKSLLETTKPMNKMSDDTEGEMTLSQHPNIFGKTNNPLSEIDIEALFSGMYEGLHNVMSSQMKAALGIGQETNVEPAFDEEPVPEDSMADMPEDAGDTLFKPTQACEKLSESPEPDEKAAGYARNDREAMISSMNNYGTPEFGPKELGKRTNAVDSNGNADENSLPIFHPQRVLNTSLNGIIPSTAGDVVSASKATNNHDDYAIDIPDGLFTPDVPDRPQKVVSGDKSNVSNKERVNLPDTVISHMESLFTQEPAVAYVASKQMPNITLPLPGDTLVNSAAVVECDDNAANESKLKLKAANLGNKHVIDGCLDVEVLQGIESSTHMGSSSVTKTVVDDMQIEMDSAIVIEDDVDRATEYDSKQCGDDTLKSHASSITVVDLEVADDAAEDETHATVASASLMDVDQEIREHGISASSGKIDEDASKPTPPKWSIGSTTESFYAADGVQSAADSRRQSVSTPSSLESKASHSPKIQTPDESQSRSRLSRRSISSNDYKSDTSAITEAVSFFAVKHLVALLREVAECLSAGENAEERWQHVLGMQSRAQRFINEAVRVNFEYDDLSQYQLVLPKKLNISCVAPKTYTPPNELLSQQSKPKPPVVRRSSQPETRIVSTTERSDKPLSTTPVLSNTESTKVLAVEETDDSIPIDVDIDAEIERFITQQTQKNTQQKEDPVNAATPVESDTEAFGLPKIRTMNDLKQSKELERSAKRTQTNNVESQSNKKTKRNEDLFEDDEEDIYGTEDFEQDAAGDISHLSDPLAEARKIYMEKVNSFEIDGMDLRVPKEVLQSNIQLFREQFEFSQKVNEVNTTVFGYSSFRGVQLAAINAVLLGRDCFLMMATGGGKSHCYQLPSLLLGGVVVVFSPLISLMEDQMRVLRSYGITADTINASTTAAATRQIAKRYLDKQQNFENGSILFITPEKFEKSSILLKLLDDLCESERLKLFVIDEAHCVSQWGLSFRKDYRQLCNLKEKYPHVPILAMTATATEDVATDIMRVLQIPRCVKLRTTINRPNLWIECREKSKDYLKEMIDILKTTTGCGIVYTLTVGDSEKVAESLQKSGISAGVYHARLDINDRKEIQQKWTSGVVRVMVATIAFGMGIDKPDVRFVFHTSAPVSILGYYQEIGRAGRDGKYSTTILWYNMRDFERHKNLGHKTPKTKGVPGDEIAEYPSLSNMREFCQNKSTCRRLMLFRAFGEDPTGVLPPNCNGCDNCCLNCMTERVDATDDAITICEFVNETMSRRTKGILTINILCDALRGSNRSTLIKYRLHQNSSHGVLKTRKPKYIFQVIQEMVNLRILRECRRSSNRFGRTVLLLGPAATKLRRRQISVHIINYQFAQNHVPEPVGATPPDAACQAEQPVSAGAKRSQVSQRSATQEPAESRATSQALKGVGVAKIVEALKAASAAGRHDGERADAHDRKLGVQGVSLIRENQLSLVSQGMRAPDDVRRGSPTAAGATKAATDSTVPAKPRRGRPPGSTKQKSKNAKQAASSSINESSVSQQKAGTSNTPPNPSTSDANAAAWRNANARALKLTPPGGTNPSVDIQAALHNNIRRKVPPDLVSSLS